MISGFDRAHIGQNIAGFTSEPDPVDLQRHRARQIVHRFAMGPFLQDLADPEKEHDRRSCAVITAQDRGCDRAGVQDRHFKFSPGQTAESVRGKTDAVADDPDLAHKIREKESAEAVSQNSQYKSGLIPAIEGPPRVLGHQRSGLFILIGKDLQRLDDHLSCVHTGGIEDDRVAGPVIDLDFSDKRLIQKIVFQKIRLFQRHAAPENVDPHSSGSFMKDPAFHDFSQEERSALASSISFSSLRRARSSLISSAAALISSQFSLMVEAVFITLSHPRFTAAVVCV